MTAPRSNIELKARLDDLPAARAVAAKLATGRLGILHQVDTYFHCPQGRLKLRELVEADAAGERAKAQLIAYQRADEVHSRQSRYHLIEVADAAGLKSALSATLGVRAVASKRREVFLVDNVRIHLDEVQDLGAFLEFEAVLTEGIQPEEGHRQLARLREQFGLTDEQLLDTSYGDMLGA